METLRGLKFPKKIAKLRLVANIINIFGHNLRPSNVFPYDFD
jgi:hypothetical protein